jgi:hypothetical protein
MRRMQRNLMTIQCCLWTLHGTLRLCVANQKLANLLISGCFLRDSNLRRFDGVQGYAGRERQPKSGAAGEGSLAQRGLGVYGSP